MGLFPHDHKREMAFGDRSVRPVVPRVVGREEKEKDENLTFGRQLPS